MAAPPQTLRPAGTHPVVGNRRQLRKHELDSLLVRPPSWKLEEGSARNLLRVGVLSGRRGQVVAPQCDPERGIWGGADP